MEIEMSILTGICPVSSSYVIRLVISYAPPLAQQYKHSLHTPTFTVFYHWRPSLMVSTS